MCNIQYEILTLICRLLLLLLEKTNINNNLSCTTRDILVWDNVTEQPTISSEDANMAKVLPWLKTQEYTHIQTKKNVERHRTFIAPWNLQHLENNKTVKRQ